MTECFGESYGHASGANYPPWRGAVFSKDGLICGQATPPSVSFDPLG